MDSSESQYSARLGLRAPSIYDRVTYASVEMCADIFRLNTLTSLLMKYGMDRG